MRGQGALARMVLLGIALVACWMMVSTSARASGDAAIVATSNEAATPHLTLDVLGPQEVLLGMPTREATTTLEARVRAAADDPPRLGRLNLNGRPVWRKPLAPTATNAPVELSVRIQRLPLWIGVNDFTLDVVAASGRVVRATFSLLRQRADAAWPALDARDPATPLPPAPDVLAGDRDIVRELIVPKGKTLTVRAGSVLRFAPGVGVTVHGTLRVEGEAQRPVWFVPSNLGQRWANVVVTGPEAKATFAHTNWYRGAGRPDDWVEDRTVPRVPRVGESHVPSEDISAQLTGRDGTDGGGLMVIDACPTRPVRLTDCRMVDCRATSNADEWGLGGAIFVERAGLVLERTTLRGNQAAVDGGAIYAFRDARLAMRDSVIEHNRAGRDGGAMTLLGNQEAEMHNVTWRHNVAGRNGGAINLNLESIALVRASRFAHNVAGQTGGAFLVVRNREALLHGCRFVDNQAGLEGGGGTCAVEAVVAIEECSFARNAAGTTGGGLTIWNSSPNLSNCEVEHNRAEQPQGAGGIAVRYIEAQAQPFRGARLTRDELQATNLIRNNEPTDLVLE